MSKIRIMSPDLTNKIAAGEVVEKCVSVVKELVENSIDAGSTEIKVSLVDGGLKEIKVSDNGMGMSKEDALLAFMPHATSKIYKEDDLYFINTLGFRGEALASIASVSEVFLKTNESQMGIELNLKGGEVVDQKNSDGKIGTTIIIKNLFYNTPARLKHLKSITTELAWIVNFIEKIALSYPNIKICLSNNNKKMIKTSGSNNLLKTINEIYGLQVSQNMIQINCCNDDYEIKGFICKPSILRSNQNHIITFVNHRIIKNSTLNRLINDAYYTYKPAIKYPIVIINIDVDSSLIDVNIHPTKQDIKFSKIKELKDLLYGNIKNALNNNLLIPNIETSHYISEKEDMIIYEEKEQFIKSEQTSLSFIDNKEEKRIRELKIYPVGIALGTYIIAQNEDGMYLLDQHAVQERINYERYLNALKEKERNSISLLIPLTLELKPSEYLVVKDNINILNNIGFKIEEFGLNTFRVIEHPTWLKEGYETESIRRIIDIILITKEDFDEIKFNENIAITLACKMSIKANEEMSLEAANSLIEQLFRTSNPYNCPHGRPTIVTFKTYELEKMFKRVMN